MSRFSLGPKKNLFTNNFQQNPIKNPKKESPKIKTKKKNANAKQIENETKNDDVEDINDGKGIHNEKDINDGKDINDEKEIHDGKAMNESNFLIKSRPQLENEYQAAYMEHQLLIKQLSQLIYEDMTILNSKPPKYIPPNKYPAYKPC